MKAVICDDDPQVCSQISTLMKCIAKQTGCLLEVSEYSTPNQLLFAMGDAEASVDILILDVLMPSMNGIEVARHLRIDGFTGVIIYLTRTADFAIQAFDVEAFSYILKKDGVLDDRIEKVLRKAIAVARKRQREYILLNGISQYCNVPIDEILYFEVNKHICTVHWGKNRTFEFISTLDRVNAMLSEYGFVRVHRSFLVKSTAIVTFSSKQIELVDGSVIQVGRQRWPELRRAMAEQASISEGIG